MAASQWAAASVREDYPACTTEIVVLPNPVHLDAFDPAWIEERFARAAAADYRPRVLFMGGDFVRKGGDLLLQAWRDGRFAERASLDLVTSRAVEGLPPGVTLHTGVEVYSERWRQFWRNADLFVLPTRDEAFGLVFQEAAAAALPAIGTRINAIPELVIDRRTGILIDPDSAPAIAAALNQLLASRETRRMLGENARQHVGGVADPAQYRSALASAIHKVSTR